jgi:hypothetical protein
MKDFIKTMDNLPWIVKLILCLPALDIVWNIVRLLKSYSKSNMVGLVLAIALLFIGVPFMWLIDLICVFLNGKIWWID